jgi:UDP-sulfoquinovose synthase
MINLIDTVECIRLASEFPAGRGEFRVFNQITESKSVREIAQTIADAFPGEVSIELVENPRVEQEDHYYNVKHTALVELGLQPTLLSSALIDHMFDVVERHKDRVDLAAIMPTVNWRETHSELPRTGAELTPAS